jgi:chromosome segregation ATPase
MNNFARITLAFGLGAVMGRLWAGTTTGSGESVETTDAPMVLAATESPEAQDLPPGIRKVTFGVHMADTSVQSADDLISENKRQRGEVCRKIEDLNRELDVLKKQVEQVQASTEDARHDLPGKVQSLSQIQVELRGLVEGRIRPPN